MFWPKTSKQRHLKATDHSHSDFDESLLLIVDPEQLSSNLLSRLQATVDVQDAVVYVRTSTEGARAMSPVGLDRPRSLLPNLNSKGRLTLWFQSNRQPLAFERKPEVMRYLHDEIHPFVQEGFNVAFPLESMDRLIGVLFLQIPADSWQSTALPHIQTLIRRSGLAFENALLFKERLHQNERMFRAEQLATMGQFAAGIAHELRNPLTAIRSTIQFLGDEFESSSPPHNLAQGVLDEVDRLNAIVENLLALARPTDSHPQCLHLATEVQDYLPFVEAQARKQGISIQLQLSPDLPAVYCDPGELRQLLLNLIVNGIQAMPDGGPLSITAQHQKPDHQIILHIQDQGPGIPTDLRERVFEPFFTTKKEGTGLGLAICRTIVRRHKGDIWIDEHTDPGICICVSLPTEEDAS